MDQDDLDLEKLQELFMASGSQPAAKVASKSKTSANTSANNKPSHAAGLVTGLPAVVRGGVVEREVSMASSQLLMPRNALKSVDLSRINLHGAKVEERGAQARSTLAAAAEPHSTKVHARSTRPTAAATKKKSLFAKQFDSAYGAKKPEADPPKQVGASKTVITGQPEYQPPRAGTADQPVGTGPLAHMTRAQIEEGLEEVHHLLSAENIAFLQQRRAKQQKDASATTSKHAEGKDEATRSTPSKATSDKAPLKVQADGGGNDKRQEDAQSFVTPQGEAVDPKFAEALPIKPKPSWLHMNVIEPDKLAWMLDKQQSSSSDPSASQDTQKQVRFDFDGIVVDEERSEKASVREGLHHHGDNPDDAGYTVAEACILARSSVSSQRIIGLNILAAVAMRAVNGEYKDLRLCSAIVSAMLRAGVGIIGLAALQDRSIQVNAAAAKLLSALFGGSLPLQDLDDIFDSQQDFFVGNSARENNATAQVDEDEEELFKSVETQLAALDGSNQQGDIVSAFGDDPLPFLVDNGLLQQSLRVLEAVEPHEETGSVAWAPVCGDLLDVMVHAAAHSHALADRILKHRGLLSKLQDMFFSKAMTTDVERIHLCKTLRLLRVMASWKQSTALQLLDHGIGRVAAHTTLIIQTESASDSSLQVGQHALRLWNCFLRYGFMGKLFTDHFAHYMGLLRSNLSIVLAGQASQQVARLLCCLVDALSALPAVAVSSLAGNAMSATEDLHWVNVSQLRPLLLQTLAESTADREDSTWTPWGIHTAASIFAFVAEFHRAWAAMDVSDPAIVVSRVEAAEQDAHALASCSSLVRCCLQQSTRCIRNAATHSVRAGQRHAHQRHVAIPIGATPSALNVAREDRPKSALIGGAALLMRALTKSNRATARIFDELLLSSDTNAYLEAQSAFLSQPNVFPHMTHQLHAAQRCAHAATLLCLRDAAETPSSLSHHQHLWANALLALLCLPRGEELLADQLTAGIIFDANTSRLQDATCSLYLDYLRAHATTGPRLQRSRSLACSSNVVPRERVTLDPALSATSPANEDSESLPLSSSWLFWPLNSLVAAAHSGRKHAKATDWAVLAVDIHRVLRAVLDVIGRSPHAFGHVLGWLGCMTALLQVFDTDYNVYTDPAVSETALSLFSVLESPAFNVTSYGARDEEKRLLEMLQSIVYEFGSMAVGDQPFSAFLSLVCQQRWPTDFRLVVLSEEAAADAMSAPSSLFSQPQQYLFPLESNRRMIDVYSGIIHRGKVSRDSMAYWTAVHHVCAFVFQDFGKWSQHLEMELQGDTHVPGHRTSILQRLVRALPDVHYINVLGYACPEEERIGSGASLDAYVSESKFSQRVTALASSIRNHPDRSLWEVFCERHPSCADS